MNTVRCSWCALPNGSRLSCGRPARRRKSSGRQSVPRQGRNTPIPLKRSAPASLKRLLGSPTTETSVSVECVERKHDLRRRESSRSGCQAEQRSGRTRLSHDDRRLASRC